MTRKLAAVLVFTVCFAVVHAFVPVSFETAARIAPTVLLGACEFGPSGQCHFRVVEVMKSVEPKPKVVTIKRVTQFYFTPLEGNLYLVVLDERGEPYDAGIACGTINILGVGPDFLYWQEPMLNDEIGLPPI